MDAGRMSNSTSQRDPTRLCRRWHLRSTRETFTSKWHQVPDPKVAHSSASTEISERVRQTTIPYCMKSHQNANFFSSVIVGHSLQQGTWGISRPSTLTKPSCMHRKSKS